MWSISKIIQWIQPWTIVKVKGHVDSGSCIYDEHETGKHAPVLCGVLSIHLDCCGSCATSTFRGTVHCSCYLEIEFDHTANKAELQCSRSGPQVLKSVWCQTWPWVRTSQQNSSDTNTEHGGYWVTLLDDQWLFDTDEAKEETEAGYVKREETPPNSHTTAGCSVQLFLNVLTSHEAHKCLYFIEGLWCILHTSMLNEHKKTDKEWPLYRWLYEMHHFL